jgi:tape measure domain-containing protein
MNNDDQKVYLRIELDTSQIPKAKQETVDAIKGMGDAVKDYIGVERSELLALNKEFQNRNAQYKAMADSIGVTVAELRKLIKAHQDVATAADRAAKSQEREDKRAEVANNRKLAQIRKQAAEVSRIENQIAANAKKEADIRIKAADDIAKAQARITQIMNKQNQTDASRNAGGSGGLFRNALNSSGTGGGLGGVIGGGSGGSGGGLGSLLGGGGSGGSLLSELTGAGVIIGGLTAALELLKAAMAAVWELAKQGASAWLKYSGTIEQARIGFKTLLGSAEAADVHIKELQQFSVTTPYQFDDLAQASRSLLAMGTAAKDVLPILTAVGNAASAAGGDFQEKFVGASQAFAKIQALGRLTSKEFLQLARNGIPVMRVLSTELGKTSQETLKLIRSGKVTSELFIRAFSEFSKNKFGDAMKEQSKTFYGALSNIEDALLIKSEIAFHPLFEAISKISNFFANEIVGADGILDIITGSANAMADAGALIGGAMIDGMVEILVSPVTQGKIINALMKLNPLHMASEAFVRATGFETPDSILDAARKKYRDKKAFENFFTVSLKKDDSVDLEKLLGDTDKKNKVKSEFEQLTIKLRELTKDIKGFLETGSKEFKLRIKVEDATRFKADLESIITLRRELSLPLDSPLPQNGKAAKDLLDDLKSFKRVKDDVNSASDETLKANEALASAILKLTIPVVDLETRTQIKYISYIRERQDAENELTATLDLMVKKREVLLNDESANLRNNYTQLRIDVIKENDDARVKEIRARLRRLIAEGGEESIIADVRKQLEITVKNQAPTVLMTISTQVQKILDALTKGKVENPPGSNKPMSFGDGIGNAGRVSSNLLSENSSRTNWLPSTGRFSKQGFNPNFENGLEAVFAYLEGKGLHPSVKSGVRTASQQRSLFMRGKPTPYDGSPGNESVHQLGGAADIVFGNGERSAGIAAIAKFVADHPEFLQAGFVKNRFGKSIDDRGHFALRREFLTNEFSQQAASQANNFSWNNFRALNRQSNASGWSNFRALTVNGFPEDSSIETDKVKVEGKDFAKIAGVSDDTAKRLLNADFDNKISDTLENINRLKEQETKWDDKTYTTAYNTLKLEEARRLKKEALRAQAEEENRNIILLNDDLRNATAKNADWIEKVQRRAVTAHLEQQIAAKEQIVTLQYDIAHASEGAADRYQVAWLEAIKEVQGRDEEAVKRQIKAQIELGDAQTVHADQIRADIYEHAAQAGTVSGIISHAFISTADAIGDGFSKMFGVLTAKLGAAGKIINDIASSLLRMVTNRLLMRLVDSIFGGGSSGNQNSSGGSGGGIIGSIIGGIGGIFGGGNRAAGTNQFAGGGGLAGLAGLGAGVAGTGIGGGLNQFADPSTLQTLSGQAAQQQHLQQILGSGAGTAAGTGGGILSSLAASAPLLGLTLGAGFGASLGKNNKTAQILGAIGLGGVGVVAGSALPSILAGTFAGLTALGTVTLGAGFALAIAAYFLGRNSQRKKDEATRAQLLGDAESQLDQLINKVRAHQMDGQEALASAATIRQSYLDAGAQIKDKKTRAHHMQDVSRLDLKIATLRQAASQSANEQQVFSQFTPAFATGGVVPGQRGAPRLVLAHGGEIISSLSQQTPAFLQAAAQAGVPGVAGTNESGSSRHGNIHLELHLGTDTQNQLFENGAKSDKGFNAHVANSKKASRYREG